MKRFLLGLLLGIVLVPVCGYFYLRSGRFPMETSAPPLPFERRLAHMALEARMERNPPGEPTIPASEANLIAGAKIYREQCAGCHGFAEQEQDAGAAGMFPKPPVLVRGKGVTDDPPGEIFWKANYGIRLSGMPAFMGTLTNEQLWQVSLFLLNANKLPEEARKLVSRP